jgi:hypothetical protein
MKTMKTIKYVLILLISISTFTSCLVEDNEKTEDYDNGPNLIGFTTASTNVSGVANGDEYVFNLTMAGVGPTITEATEDVTVRVAVDPASTAVRGTHFELSKEEVTLLASNNYINSFPLTMLSEGIQAPLATNPYVILNITEVDSNGNFVNNGRTGSIKVNLLYLCFSNLAGNYAVNMRYIRAASGIDQTLTFDDTITQTGDGQYRTGRVGHWEASALGGTPGYSFTDVCNVITIPYQNLVDLYSNEVEGVPGKSSVNPDTGVITFEYTITGGNLRQYFVTYTPK